MLFHKLIYVLITLSIGTNIDQQTLEKNVYEFIRLLKDKPVLTISDYFHYYSHHDEDEISILDCVCKKRGLTYKKYSEYGYVEDNCLDFINGRLNNPEAPSLYLHWLRSKLPIKSEFHIEKVERIDAEIGFYDFYGLMGNTRVKLQTPYDSNFVQVLGRVVIGQINEVNVNKLFDEDQKKGEICTTEIDK